MKAKRPRILEYISVASRTAAIPTLGSHLAGWGIICKGGPQTIKWSL